MENALCNNPWKRNFEFSTYVMLLWLDTVFGNHSKMKRSSSHFFACESIYYALKNESGVLLIFITWGYLRWRVAHIHSRCKRSHWLAPSPSQGASSSDSKYASTTSFSLQSIDGKSWLIFLLDHHLKFMIKTDVIIFIGKDFRWHPHSHFYREKFFRELGRTTLVAHCRRAISLIQNKFLAC